MGVELQPGTGDSAPCGRAGAGRARRPGCWRAPRLRSRGRSSGSLPPPAGLTWLPGVLPNLLGWCHCLAPGFHFPCGDLLGFPFEGNLLARKANPVCLRTERYIY